MEIFSSGQLILTGFGIGLLISAPIGPVNVLLIRRTLSRGFWAGFATGIGAIIADLFISSVAVFGMNAISELIRDHLLIMQIIGGLILIGFGINLSFARTQINQLNGEDMTLTGNAGVIPQSFLMTISNPGAVLGIFAVFGSVGSLIGGLNDYVATFTILIGLFGGMLSWWIGFAKLIATFRHQMTDVRLNRINKIAAFVLIFCGMILFARALSLAVLY